MTDAPRSKVLIGDARETVQSLADASIDMVLTSPPYFRLRNYRVSGQLGAEDHVDDWVTQLRAVAAEVARVLTPSGSFWLNVADTYSAHPRQGGASRSLLLGPERLLLTLQADGWLVRNKIVWAKTNPMPTSARTRFASTHESLFLLTRSPSYFFDLDAVRVPHRSRPSTPPRRQAADHRAIWRGPNATGDNGLRALKAAGLPGHPLGKNPGDVWQLATSAYRGPHPATFPLPLAERAIQAGCPEAACVSCRQPWRRPLIRQLGGSAVRGALAATCGCAAGHRPGLVLDPFFGVGSTGLAAERLGRDWLGIELNPDFAREAAHRLPEARAGPK
ncbi:DNA-methyltransferase [uncultured Friedmanniella sp.]|uniref:DNA-methyltransferase n=1 Tax=uncultured Friedmanniella sp. TaxID=335381 RepID=UPI0035CA6CF8